ncbi:hypothetical protein Tsubulata_029029, partial [Turnera subulata]
KNDELSPAVTIKDDPLGSQVVAVQQEENRSGDGGADDDDGALESSNYVGGGGGDGGGSVGDDGGEGGAKSELVSVEVTMKKKRGRPRKYNNYDSDDTNLVSLVSPPLAFSSPLPGDKRSRGRPRGSGKLQLLASLGGFASETAGGSFTPHAVTVQTGEDVFNKIYSFAQRGSRAVCVLSATGVISSGRFEILSLSGSFTFSDMGGAHYKNGMLSVSLAKPDGRVFGGGVAGSLIAAGPIQNITREIKIRRQSAESFTVAAAVPGATDMLKIPAQIGPITDGEDNCATPMSALLEPTNGEAGNTVTVNQNLNPSSQE